jgi:hypothetical protein
MEVVSSIRESGENSWRWRFGEIRIEEIGIVFNLLPPSTRFF